MEKFEYTVLEMIESAARTVKTAPLNLGGTGGAGGGVGVPPGGFIGQLPQYRVAYDTLEAATLDTLPSGVTGISGWSLVDNLNHIRQRIGVLESGGGAGTFTVIDDTTGTTFTSVDTIHFSGGVEVTNLGSGDVRVLVTASGGSGLTGKFAIVTSNYQQVTLANNTATNLIIDTELTDDHNLVSLSANKITFNETGWYDIQMLASMTVNSGVALPNNGYVTLFLSNNGISDNTNMYVPVTSGSSIVSQEIYARGAIYMSASETLDITIENYTGSTLKAYLHEVVIRPLPDLAGGGTGATNFLELTDTPGSYTGQAGKVVAVNGTATGLEFITVSGGGTSLTVMDADGTPTVTNVDTIVFSGVDVVDLGGGNVQVSIISSGVNYDSTYLRLDAANSPVTGALTINPTSQVDPSLYVYSKFWPTVWLEHSSTGLGEFTNGQNILRLSRYPLGTDTTNFTGAALLIDSDPGAAGSITGDFIDLQYNHSTVFNITVSGHAYDNGNLLITEAPIDGYQYARKDGGWVTVSGGTGGGINFTYGTTPPGSPLAGDEWFDSNNGALFKYVNDGDSSQWVEIGTGGVVTDHTQLTNIGTVSHANLDTIVQTGWIINTSAWTRTANHTFTVSGDVTATFKKGTKIRYKDGGSYEYGVVGSSSYSVPNTTVNLIPNTDYTMAAATITDTYISYIDNPSGFPSYFNYDPSLTNISSSSTVARWYPIAPGALKYDVEFTSSGAASGSIYFQLPIANIRGTNNPVIGVCYYLDSGVASYPGQVLGSLNSTSANPIVFRYDPTLGTATQYIKQEFANATKPFTWGSGDQAQFTGDFEY